MNCTRSIISATLFALLVFGHAALAQTGPWLEPRCTKLIYDRIAPLVTLGDGSLLTVVADGAVTSQDDGKTWSAPHAIYSGPGPGIPTSDCLLLRTRAGTLLMVYYDMSTAKWGWDKAKNETIPDVRLDIWATRSLDEGKTWIDRQRLLDGYCGALINLIQTSSGQIVVPIQSMPFRNRHCLSSCVSADEGKTWKWGNVIDLGGCGDHDGAMEGTVAELSNGRVLMLVRTNLDRFWEAYSDDQGRHWREMRPSPMDASTSPGYLIRLASGRLALVWNRLHAEGKETVSGPGATSNFSADSNQARGSWYREELSLAFSPDDAKTWSKPVVIARVPGGDLSYPLVLERRPGELWVITRFQTRVCLSLKEADFVQQ